MLQMALGRQNNRRDGERSNRQQKRYERVGGYVGISPNFFFYLIFKMYFWEVCSLNLTVCSWKQDCIFWVDFLK